MRKSLVVAFRATPIALLREKSLPQYQQEAFEAHRRFVESNTYPGPIRAATPGDTRFYAGSLESILGDNERHYWRAVTDDPAVQYVFPLRIRFKTFVWVTSGWEQRLQIVQVMVPRDATVQEVIDQVRVENQSPYLCTSSLKLALDSKELDESKPISFYGIHENSRLEAIEENDHLTHEASGRPKDWNKDEMTPEDLTKSPYKEMEMAPRANLAPRYEGKPAGYFGKNDYSGMKQRS